MGNFKDELNKDKYDSLAKETEEVEESKPEEPQALTLEEYYQSKGVTLNG